MSSRPVERRSIASQLVISFTIAAVLLLSCGLGALYWIVVRHAYEEDNEVLADKVAAVRADLDSPGGINIVIDELNNSRGTERATYWVRILDSADHTVAETRGMTEVLPPSVFPKNDKRDNSQFRTATQSFTLMAVRHQIGPQPYTIQVAQDRSADDRFMKQFAFLVAAVVVLGIAASAFIAIRVTKRGLRPLAEITEAVQRVRPAQLHQRVSPAGWPRELQPLAVAFDEMLARLEESFSRLSQFSADLAHELRTPIGNIRGEAEVALTRPRTPEEYREVIESTVAECAHLTGIVDHLLFMARTEAAEGHLQRTTFSGREAIEKIVAFHEPMAEEQQVTVECQGDATFSADEMLFGRAVTNLLENALRHTSVDGKIEIVIREEAGQSQVAVKDNGTGIAAEHLPRVFDRFYRADPSRSSEGLGLGLALVKSIMDLHHGTAAIESRPGEGTLATLRFPKA
jgi:two-component system heavy metal sensor histidine kinase CusS